MDALVQVLKKLTKKINKIQKVFLVLSLILFIIMCLSSYDNFQLAKTKPDLEKTVNEFLIHTSEQDYARSYSLLTEDVKSAIDFKTFKAVFADLRIYYSDYEHNSLRTTDITRNYNPIIPTTLTYKGVITYKNSGVKNEIHSNRDKEKGTVEATFLWTNNRWELTGVYVYTPSSRLEGVNLPD